MATDILVWAQDIPLILQSYSAKNRSKINYLKPWFHTPDSSYKLAITPSR